MDKFRWYVSLHFFLMACWICSYLPPEWIPKYLSPGARADIKVVMEKRLSSADGPGYIYVLEQHGTCRTIFWAELQSNMLAGIHRSEVKATRYVERKDWHI
jgi:hypothetical protein